MGCWLLFSIFLEKNKHCHSFRTCRVRELKFINKYVFLLLSLRLSVWNFNSLFCTNKDILGVFLKSDQFVDLLFFSMNEIATFWLAIQNLTTKITNLILTSKCKILLVISNGDFKTVLQEDKNEISLNLNQNFLCRVEI